jgi:uncharacterized membrane protein
MIRIIVGLAMAAAGIIHFVYPKVYGAILPALVPFKKALVLGSGIAEVCIGIALLYSGTAKWGALGLLILMVCFLPLHVWHLFEPPAKLSLPYWAFIARAVIQFGIIYACYKLYETTNPA